jgi:hypothetical protein
MPSLCSRPGPSRGYPGVYLCHCPRCHHQCQHRSSRLFVAPFSTPHPLSGYLWQAPPPPLDRHQQPAITPQWGHQQPMPMPSVNGHRHLASYNQPPSVDQHTSTPVHTTNRQHYAPDVPNSYFQPAGYQANTGSSRPPQGYHTAPDYGGYGGQQQEFAHGPTQVLVPRIYQPNLINEDWTSKIADVIQNQFNLRPKDQSYMYRHPYPKSFDRVSLPNRYRILDFSMFSGHDNVSTIEHVS